jgi:hypothetical protein
MRWILGVVWLGVLGMHAAGDEGMWLLNNPPREILQKRHGITLSDAWLKHLQLASARLNNGGSGSFISPNGLLLTNHHVGADAMQKLSPPDKDYYLQGYAARSAAEELPCPDLEINVLQEIVDVTGRINDAVKPAMPAAEASAARRAVIAAIEKESLEKTGLRSDVVTLYNGGLYHLYRYKKYTDVRLVFAPEKAIASFGGDVDNFEFPRYDLDICFFRVYENGRPLRPQHWLTWSAEGPHEGELVFVSGHPGTTQRMETYDRLRFRRDVILPYTLARLRSREANLLQFSARSPQHAKWAQKDLYSTANARKAFSGQYQGLLDESLLQQKHKDERLLVNSSSVKPHQPGTMTFPAALEKIAQVQEKLRPIYQEHALLETGHAFDSILFKIARDLVRLAEENPKPNGQRFKEYRDSARASLELELFSPAPIHPEVEQSKLAASLTFLAERLGGEHALVHTLLQGKTADARAAELVQNCTLVSVAIRKKLAGGGTAAVAESTDPLIRLARMIDPAARTLRKQYEEEIEEPERQTYAVIANTKFSIFGTQIAPDATFTLRLAFGNVLGYQEEGKTIPYCTTLAGVFQRERQNEGKEPFTLPARWLAGKDKLDLSTPFNFVSTADTIGGNSGSPVVNAQGEFVGINFDRNRHGLVRNFVYTDVQARHIAVHSRAILETLRKLYDVPALVEEIQGPKK